MTTAVIVQARMGSTRLPAKVMADLGGKPVLAHVLKRCDRIHGIDVVVCAIPDTAENIHLMSVIRDCGARWFVGPEHDVLARYLGAAKRVGADVVVRITADCPLIDPDVCEQVIEAREITGLPYVCNVHPRQFPQGLDCEVFTFEALKCANREATDPYDREHVTPYMARDARPMMIGDGRLDLASHRWTLDYPEDLDFLRAVFAVREPQRMDDVLAILREHPEIEAINACRKAA